MALNLQVETLVNGKAQSVKDQNGNPSPLTVSTDKVGIGTTNPTQRLTLGSGNILLPTAHAGVDGNLYFGGITDADQIGMRLFGGKINNQFQSGFIDVRSGTLTDGLIFRVDTFFGGTERMRINALGNVGIIAVFSCVHSLPGAQASRLPTNRPEKQPRWLRAQVALM